MLWQAICVRVEQERRPRRPGTHASPPSLHCPALPASAATPEPVPEEGWHGRAEARGPVTAAASAASAASLPAEVSERDIRRKRPPALSFLARAATIGRGARVVSLLALDFAALALAIFTALVLKEAAHGTVDASNSVHGTKEFLPFAYLLTALLFARSGLYAERAQRPGLPRIVGSLFQVAFVALIFAVVNGEHFSSYYLFWSSLLFAIIYVSAGRAVYDRVTGEVLRAAGHQRRAVLVGRGPQIAEVANALSSGSHLPDRGARLPLPAAAGRERAAPARLARGPRAGARRDQGGRGDHRRLRLPQGRRRRARGPLPPARRDGAPRALHDGDPDPPRGVRPGPVAAAVRARPAGVRGDRLRAEADLRHRRLEPAADRSQPATARDHAGGAADLAGDRPCTAPAAAASASARSPA